MSTVIEPLSLSQRFKNDILNLKHINPGYRPKPIRRTPKFGIVRVLKSRNQKVEARRWTNRPQRMLIRNRHWSLKRQPRSWTWLAQRLPIASEWTTSATGRSVGLRWLTSFVWPLPAFFTWTALIVALVMHWMAGSLGICLGYHRLLTHSGMKTYNWVRYFFAGMGCFAGEGSPLDWVADHRKHHAHSDQEGDPHSPARRRHLEPHVLACLSHSRW